ncbi:MAG TPA: hypothetical protein VH257_05200 [Chloroflexota bacterium]|nr:hypothetical protein [Chloroflexota bacterium]
MRTVRRETILVVDDEPIVVEVVQRYLGPIRGEVQHLSRLIDDLFELSQIESGALQLRLTPHQPP